MGDSFASAASAGGHTDTANGVAADRRGNGAVILLRPAMDQSNVSFLYAAAGEFVRELAVGGIIFRDDEKSAGFLVEPMNDAGTELAANTGELPESMNEGIDQRPAISVVVRCAGAGVHHHARRFVDDREVVVLVNDVERDIFSHGFERGAFSGAEDRNGFVAAKFKRGLARHSIDQHLLLGDQFLDTRATDIRKM